MGQPNRELKQARLSVGLTQDDVAKALRIGVKTYSGWECGDHIPYLRHRRALAPILKLSVKQVNAFFGESGSPSSNGDIPDATIELNEASEYREEQNRYLQSNLGSRLLGIVDAGPYDDQRKAFAQIMEQFDAMNTENRDYEITRRQTVISLATFPFAPPLNLEKRERVASSHHELFLQECGASLTACEELARSSDPDDLELAFRCACRYLVELKDICNTSLRYRTQALELAAHYAILKSNLGWGRVGNAAVLLFAQDALTLALESGNICLLLSAYSKLSWAYLYDDQRKLALDTATIAGDLLKRQKERLPVCIRGGTWSTLSVMQARNKQLSDAARKKALEQGPDTQVLYGMDFTGGRMWMEQGEALYYARKPVEALGVYAEIVNLDTMEIVDSFKGVLTATQRVETILDMSRASTKGKSRNMGDAARYWEEAIEGAKKLKCKSLCDAALTAYDLMETAFPDDQEVYDLHDHIKDIDKSLRQ